MALTKKERAVLRQAADIAARELEKGNEVRLPGFGKLYLCGVEVETDFASRSDGWLPDAGEVYSERVFKRSVRFRPWDALKRRLNT